MERYERLEELGQGTYGIVWKALDRQTNEVVAIKQLKDKYHSYEDCMNLVEVKSLSKVNNHPNIVKLKEIIKQNNIMYLVFEYMECSLEKRIEEQTKPLSEAEIKDLCFQLFQGLEYIHSKGYIHRDLKPENLLVSKNVIKISDFGHARRIDNEIPYTEYVTTRWYRAPEVLLGAKVYDFAVDMWAMGAIMVELFNLEPLFGGASGEAVLYKICRVIGTPTESTWTYGLNLASDIGFEFPKFDGVKFSELMPTASPEAVDLIAKLLSWNPVQRGTATGALEHPFFDSCMKKVYKGESTFRIEMQRELLKQKRHLKGYEDDPEDLLC